MLRARFGGPSRFAYPPLQGWLSAVLVALALAGVGCSRRGDDAGTAGYTHGASSGEDLTYASWQGRGTAWCPPWVSSGNDPNSVRFGCSVACAGDVNGDGYADVIIGSWGKAYLFPGSPAGLHPIPNWESSGVGHGDSVASAGDVDRDGFDDVVVGDPSFHTSVGSAVGRASLYRGGPSGLETIPAWTSSGDDQSYAWYASSVASAGDVNRDGYADVIVGARYHNAWLGGEGMAYLYLGGSSGLAAVPAWTHSGETQPMAQFGSSVASAGDVNGDGFDDVIVGAHYFESSIGEEGKAYLFLGDPAGLGFLPAWTSLGEDRIGAWFGWSVASAGDVNGDGYADVIVGAPLNYGTGRHEGKAFLFLGSAVGLDPAPAWTSSGFPRQDASFGTCVASAGDVNGDGFFDVVIGAYGHTTTVGDVGMAYVFRGGPSGLAPDPAWTSSGEDRAGSEYGLSVASAGDVNGNRLSGVVVGAPYSLIPPGGSGRAYVYCLPP